MLAIAEPLMLALIFIVILAAMAVVLTLWLLTAVARLVLNVLTWPLRLLLYAGGPRRWYGTDEAARFCHNTTCRHANRRTAWYCSRCGSPLLRVKWPPTRWT